MPLYLIALLPPPSVQEAVTQIKQHFADRYASRRALNSPPHITLQPPFERSLTPPSATTPSQIALLEAGLSQFAATHAPVLVQLAGFAAFPPRVIYVNVLKTATLMTLQANLTAYLQQDFGIVDPSANQRPFAPHMTVAYRDLTQANFRAGWTEFQHQPFEAQFLVPTLTLLIHNGQRWLVQREFEFQA